MCRFWNIEKKWEWSISRCFIIKLFNILSNLHISTVMWDTIFLIPAFRLRNWSLSFIHLSSTNQWWKGVLNLNLWLVSLTFSVLQWKLTPARKRVIRKNSGLYRLDLLSEAASLFSPSSVLLTLQGSVQMVHLSQTFYVHSCLLISSIKKFF